MPKRKGYNFGKTTRIEPRVPQKHGPKKIDNRTRLIKRKAGTVEVKGRQGGVAELTLAQDVDKDIVLHDIAGEKGPVKVRVSLKRGDRIRFARSIEMSPNGNKRMTIKAKLVIEGSGVRPPVGFEGIAMPKLLDPFLKTLQKHFWQ